MDADHPGGRHLVPREPGRHVAVPRHQLAAAELLVVDLGNDEEDKFALLWGEAQLCLPYVC